jgi:hypothetical protein
MKNSAITHQNSSFRPLSVFVMLIAVMSFYWFEWRPIEIRKSCTLSAKNRAYDMEFGGNTREESRTLYDHFYLRCIRESGIDE